MVRSGKEPNIRVGLTCRDWWKKYAWRHVILVQKLSPNLLNTVPRRTLSFADLTICWPKYDWDTKEGSFEIKTKARLELSFLGNPFINYFFSLSTNLIFFTFLLFLRFSVPGPRGIHTLNRSGQTQGRQNRNPEPSLIVVRTSFLNVLEILTSKSIVGWAVIRVTYVFYFGSPGISN